MTRDRQQPKLNAHDRAVIAETIGYLRGVASVYNSDDYQHQWATQLATRLDNLRVKVWPVKDV